ncbi:hypothetical protein [Lysinibacillus sp. FJAT-14745]|nr:hypothetical protein [Lysinibacillus sp. FJAT-14745]
MNNIRVVSESRKENMFRVYDDRTNETLYQNKDNIECVVLEKLCSNN